MQDVKYQVKTYWMRIDMTRDTEINWHKMLGCLIVRVHLKDVVQKCFKMEKLHFVALASPSLFLLKTIFGQKSSNNSSFQGRQTSPGKSVKNVPKKNFLFRRMLKQWLDEGLKQSKTNMGWVGEADYNLAWSWPCHLSWSLRPCQSALAQCEDNDMGPCCAWLIGICMNMYH